MMSEVPGLNGWIWLAGFCAPLLAVPLFKKMFRSILRVSKKITLTEDHLILGSKRFSRLVEHRFELLPHPKAKLEQIKNEIKAKQAQLKGQVIAPQRYYQESYRLVCRFPGRIVTIATIFGEEEAMLIGTRLQGITEVLNGMTAPGAGAVLEPKHKNTSSRAGRIPE